jgi:hypothetical protein
MKITLVFQAPAGAATGGISKVIESSEASLIPNVEDHVFMNGTSRKVLARAFTFNENDTRINFEMV